MVPYPIDTVPGQRFRIEQWAPYLKADGIDIDFAPCVDTHFMDLLYQPGRVMAKASGIMASSGRRALDLASIRRYDAVFLYRAAALAGPAILERVLARLGRPVIFDFDDAIYLLDTNASNRRFGWLKFPKKTMSICRLSSHVVVGNDYLAEYARQFNDEVTVVPTSIDTEYYQPRSVDTVNKRVVVGWTGSSTSQYHLESYAPMLKELVTRWDVELRIISNREPDLPGIPYVWRPWASETEVDELSAFDIGIMPLPDDEWSRGKCALKALQCMAMGVPTVCSAVGANCEVVRHGENSFLAATPEEWFTHLGSLIEQPELRFQVGAEARRTVEASYSMQVCAQQFAEVVRHTVEQARGVVQTAPRRA